MHGLPESCVLHERAVNGGERGPRRAVVSCSLEHNAHNAGSMWALRLECGHYAGRVHQAGKGNRNWKRRPQPKFVYCKRCLEQAKKAERAIAKAEGK